MSEFSFLGWTVQKSGMAKQKHSHEIILLFTWAENHQYNLAYLTILTMCISEPIWLISKEYLSRICPKKHDVLLKRSCSLTLNSFTSAKLSPNGCLLLLCWDITDSRAVFVTDSLIWFEYRLDVNGKASFMFTVIAMLWWAIVTVEH